MLNLYIVVLKWRENIMINSYDNTEYIVIKGKELCRVKKDFHFWKGRHSQKEFKRLVKNSQQFFTDFQLGKDCSGYQVEGLDAMSLYVDISNAVTVNRTPKGYEIASNGRHRAYVAKKYKLNLLVCVM